MKTNRYPWGLMALAVTIGAALGVAGLYAMVMWLNANY